MGLLKKINKIIFINFGGRKENYFFLFIFYISPHVFTQISIGRARWMWNYPMSTHSAYFWRTPLPQKQEIPEKRDDLIPHPTSSPDQNLSKNMGRYVKNTNKKVVFFFSSSKINKYYFIILTIILLILFRTPILSWNFL